MALEDRVERLEEESRQTRELVTTCAQVAQNAQVAHEQNRVLLNAVAEVQGNHTDRLTTIDGRLDGIDGRLDGIDGRLDGIEGRMQAVERKLIDHDLRFNAVDRRFNEVERRFNQVDRKLEAFDKQLSDMRGTIGKVAVGMYTLEKLIRRIVPEDDARES